MDTSHAAHASRRRRLFAADLAAGFLVGFVAALLAPRRPAERKPPTEARMRPPVENGPWPTVDHSAESLATR